MVKIFYNLWRRPEFIIWFIRGFLTQLIHLRFCGIILMERGSMIQGIRGLKISGPIKLGKYSTLDIRRCESVEIGSGFSLGAFSILRLSGSEDFVCPFLNIGNRVTFGPYCNIGGGFGLIIGDDVIAGPYVSIHPETHNYATTEQPIRLQGVSGVGIKIASDCWLGAKATILDGVVLENGSIVGAAVTLSHKKTTAGGIYVGFKPVILKYRKPVGF